MIDISRLSILTSRYYDQVERVLAEWRRERPDIDPSPMELPARIGRLYQQIQADRLTAGFARFGLKPGEFDVLSALRRAGSPFRRTPTELYQALMVTSGTLTNRLDRLEGADLIRRLPDPSDRRGSLVQLTADGLDLVNRTVEAHLRTVEGVQSGLTEEERRTLARLLRRWEETLAGPPV
jgi:DNA-binding MarR family transcriptional regulator